jgi:hypothetical protein
LIYLQSSRAQSGNINWFLSERHNFEAAFLDRSVIARTTREYSEENL